MVLAVNRNVYWKVDQINEQTLLGLHLSEKDFAQLSKKTVDKLRGICEGALNSLEGKKAATKALGRNQSIEFSLEMSEKGSLCLRVNGDVIPVSNAKSAQQVIQQMYQEASRKQIGKVSSPSFESPSQDRLNRIQDAFNRAKEERDRAGEKGPISKVLGVVSEAGDTTANILSLGRNILAATTPDPDAIIRLKDTAVKVVDVVGGMGLATGFLGTVGSALAIRNGVKEFSVAKTHGNTEGKVLAAVDVINATDGMVASSLMVTQNTAKFAGAAGVASAAANALPFAGFAVYLFGLLANIYKTGVIVNFRSFMQNILNQPGKENKSGEVLRESLAWLQQQITLSEFEEIEIQNKALDEGKDPRKEMQNVLQKKWDQFELRTSSDVRKLIGEQVTEDLLGKVKNGDGEAIEKAKEIIGAVDKASFQRLAMRALSITILVIGIIGLVCAVICTGPIAPILFAVTALISLPLDLQYTQRRLNNGMYSIYERFVGLKWYESEKGTQALRGREVMTPPMIEAPGSPLFI